MLFLSLPESTWPCNIIRCCSIPLDWPWLLFSWDMFMFGYVHVYTWNPNDPCFDWNFGRVLEGWSPKIEDKQVPGSYSSYRRVMIEMGLDLVPIATLSAIPGVSKMTEGKYKNNPTMNLQEIYLKDKGYVKWIREHIGSHSAMSMRMLKAYIQARDQNKKERLGMQPVDPMTSTPPWRNMRGAGGVDWKPDFLVPTIYPKTGVAKPQPMAHYQAAIWLRLFLDQREGVKPTLHGLKAGLVSRKTSAPHSPHTILY